MEVSKEELLTMFKLLDTTWEKRPLTDEEAFLYMNIKKILER